MSALRTTLMIMPLISPRNPLPMWRIAPVRFYDLCFVYAPHRVEFRLAVLQLDRPEYHVQIANP